MSPSVSRHLPDGGASLPFFTAPLLDSLCRSGSDNGRWGGSADCRRVPPLHDHKSPDSSALTCPVAANDEFLLSCLWLVSLLVLLGVITAQKEFEYKGPVWNIWSYLLVLYRHLWLVGLFVKLNIVPINKLLRVYNRSIIKATGFPTIWTQFEHTNRKRLIFKWMNLYCKFIRKPGMDNADCQTAPCVFTVFAGLEFHQQRPPKENERLQSQM